MVGPNFTIFEDITMFDIVWKCVSAHKSHPGPGEPGDSWAFFTVERRAPTSTSNPTNSTPVPMIATFDWEYFSAKFTCDYD